MDKFNVDQFVDATVVVQLQSALNFLVGVALRYPFLVQNFQYLYLYRSIPRFTLEIVLVCENRRKNVRVPV